MAIKLSGKKEKDKQRGENSERKRVKCSGGEKMERV